MASLRWEQPRTGHELGGWVLREVIGEGGNAFVWRAERRGTWAALKVLKPPHGSERYERFAQEVKVHLEVLRDVRGVLPLLEADVPTGSAITSPPWLAMPIAENLTKKLGGAPLVSIVVAIVAEIAETMASLHEQFGVSHRDIKPENLYWHDGGAAIGDFGLVEVPGGPDLSRSDRDLGPRDFLAPEMRAGSPLRQGPPADVFSLGLTTFALVTGSAPRDGLRADEPSHLLAGAKDDLSLRSLDSALQRATSYRPEQRPTMHELASDLRSWLDPPLPLPVAPDLASLRVRAEALRPRPDPARRLSEPLLSGLQDLVFNRSKPTFDALNQLGLDTLQRSVRLFERWDDDGLGIRTGSSLTFQPPGSDGATWFGGGVAYGEGDDGLAHISLGWVVAPFDDFPEVAWSIVELVDVRSPAALRRVEELVGEWASAAVDIAARGIAEAERFGTADIRRDPADVDHDPPELVALALDVRPVRQRAGFDVIALARMRDAIGMAGNGYTSSQSQVRLRGDGGVTLDAMLSADGDRVSGTRFDGQYEGIARLERVHPRGEWVVEHVLLADQAGRSRYLYASDLQRMGFATSLSV